MPNYNSEEIIEDCENSLSIMNELCNRLSDIRDEFKTNKKEIIVGILQKNFDNSQRKPDANKFFSKINENFWLLKTNLLGFLQITPISFLEITRSLDIYSEIHPESIFWKVKYFNNSNYSKILLWSKSKKI